MNVERAKRLDWLERALNLERNQLEAIFDEELRELSDVPEGPACNCVRARCGRCCEKLSEALQGLDVAIRAVRDAWE